jgi:signal transduction histidine kinase
VTAAPPSRTATRTGGAVRPAAVPAAVLACALSVAAVLTHLTSPSPALRTPEATVGAALAVVAALLLHRGAPLRLPVLLLGIGLSCSTYAASAAAAAATGGAGALGGTAAWLAAWTWVGGFPCLAVLLPLQFPDGRLTSPRWRPVLRAATAVVALLAVVAALAPGTAAGLDGVDNPLALDQLADVRRVVQGALVLALPVLCLTALASLVVRWRAADGVVRRQVGWFGYGLAVVVLASFVTSGWLLHLLSLALPAAVAVAVVRYRLYDLDALVDRTVVGAVLLAGAALVYAAVIGWAGAAFGEQGALPGFLAAAAVAVLFAPARRRVQVAVDRMLHGRRGDPNPLLTELAAGLQGARTPRAALHEVVSAIATGLRLPAVAARVQLPDGREVVEQSAPLAAAAHEVPLVWHGQPLGVLQVVGRPDLDAVDRRVLADLAGQVAAVAYALRLSADLEQSRQDLVTRVAEERRRLRRDLHDGLGPQLAAVALGVTTAERALGRADVERAGSLLGAARTQLEEGVAEVRRLVHGLRPPALDDVGLLDALRTTGPAAGGLDVQVQGEGDLSALPAGVEVAAYRIAQEALTNVIRHSGVSAAQVHLRVTGDELEVEVLDAGAGIPAQRTPGVGLLSMRERAEELGGTCTVQALPTGGTRVLARIPT